MRFYKNFWNNLIAPNAWFLAVFYVLFFLVVGGTITLVVLIPNQTVWHYLLYCLSALIFAYFIYSIIYVFPKIKQKSIDLMKKYKFTNRLLSNYGYRTIAFSVCSFILNISYVAYIGVLSVLTGSVWYMAITIYYLVLIILKWIVFHSKKKKTNFDDMRPEKTYRNCGIMLLVMMLAFSGIIVLIYTSNMYFEYAGLLLYAVAAFTFYKLTLAVINIFKARKQEDLYVQSIRNINLASALVSIVVLQVAMIQAFSPENNTSVANALTGGIVALLIFALGMFMIIKANKIIKHKGVENDKQQ